MNPRRALSLILAFCAPLVLAAAERTLVFSPPGNPASAKHVVLLSGDEEYRSEEALPMLAKILSQRHGFKTTVLFALDADGVINPNNTKSLPGAEALDTADAIVMSLRFRDWPEAAMKHFVDAYRRGVPIIALRTSTHAFKIPGGQYASFTDFGKRVLGEQWVSHWGRHKVEATRAVIEPSEKANPLLRGVGEIFGTTDVYEAYPPADATILLRGLVLSGMNRSDPPANTVKKRSSDKKEQPVNSPAMPVAWTRVYRNEAGRDNRILTITMGAATDFTDESLRRLVVNGVYWGLGRKVPSKADVRLVDPYAPTPYGFNGYRVGLIPADHALGKTLREGAPRAPGSGGDVKPAPVIPSRVGLPLTLSPGERIAFIGNALADRMQHQGSLETLIHARYPQYNLVVRNLGFSGDEVAMRARSKDFGTPDEWLTRVGANVVFAFFGFNESFHGEAGLPKFKEDLARFLQETHAKNYSGAGAPRIVLFSPIAAETMPDPNLAMPESTNRNLALYAAAMAEVARDRAGVTFVDLFTPSKALYAEAAKAGKTLTFDGVHLNASGDAAFAPVIFKALTGEDAPRGDWSLLKQAVNAKNEMWHSRYRTVDGYNIYGGRSTLSYVSGEGGPKISNFQVMQEEMTQRDVMTANRDKRVWSVAKGKDIPVDDSNLPPVTPVKTNIPGANPDGSHVFLGGEEAIQKMTVSPGLKVNLFASEKEFPELVKPVQMAWDTRGRLWVSVWPSYPERTPTSEKGDSLLIFEDTDGDGRADKCSHFMDDLNCPTGFQFFKDGVLLMQAPDLWFVRDTDGDGRADWKERVVMGLDSADSHHVANSLAYEPGGAIYLSDGVFLRSQIETRNGVLRNIDGAVYRYEPLTQKVETYASYNFMNPHGRTFDRWGNDLIVDATGNETFFGAAFSGKIDYPAKHPKMKQFWARPARPSAASAIITTRQFPDEFQGNFINGNVIGFQGFYRVKVVEDGSGLHGERLPDLLSSSDPNFRPVGISVGPDGGLYILDWHNPIIGHMQHHLRDPNRDAIHGRIYRIIYEGRPLLKQPKIYGQSIEALLDLLKEPENHVRELAKIELGKHESGKVMAAADAWMKRLDPNDPDYAHQLTEVLWLHQWHNVVDAPLLRRLLRYPEPNVRAAATRVLCYWRDRIPDAVQLLKVQAADENPRVRLHAIRAASFISSPEAVDAALASIDRPFDYYLDYTLGETLKQLRPHWISQLEDVAALEKENPMKIEFLLRTVPIQDLLGMKRNDRVREQLVKRTGVSQATRAEALEELVQSEKRPGAELLLGYLKQTGDNDRRAMGRLLANRPSVELKAVRDRLEGLAREETADMQPLGWAALVAADGSIDVAWTEASRGQATILALVSGIPSLADVELRAKALPLLMPLLAPLAELTKETAALQAAAIRASVSCRREPEAVFAALTALISAKQNVPTAVSGMRQLPRSAWQSAGAPALGEALVAWAEGYTAAERTTPEFLDMAQTTREFLDELPAEVAAPLRERLIRLSVPVFTIRTVREEMRYDTLRLVVEAGKPFKITLENEDSMLHNLVIVKPGARERVANAAILMSPEKLDAQGRAYVPASPDILAATRLLDAGQSETITLTAPSEEGVYEYVCTFPGHWTLMWGQLIVTRQLNAPLPSAAVAAPAGPATQHGNHSHPN